jgi:hypothetical protein
MKINKKVSFGSVILVMDVVFGCAKYENTLILGSWADPDNSDHIGPTIENQIKGFKASDQTNPTTINYNVTGNVVGNCDIAYNTTGQIDVIGGPATGTSQLWNTTDRDFLYINC